MRNLSLNFLVALSKVIPFITKNKGYQKPGPKSHRGGGATCYCPWPLPHGTRRMRPPPPNGGSFFFDMENGLKKNSKMSHEKNSYTAETGNWKRKVLEIPDRITRQQGWINSFQITIFIQFFISKRPASFSKYKQNAYLVALTSIPYPNFFILGSHTLQILQTLDMLQKEKNHHSKAETISKLTVHLKSLQNFLLPEKCIFCK